MKKCFKEWNAVVEALGQGIQTILLRKYKMNIDKFLIYPTLSYSNKDNYLSYFSENYEDFVRENLLPMNNGQEVEIKYLAQVEKIKQIKPKQAIRLSKFYIWNKNHVRSYLSNKAGYIWILRIYKLEKPHFASAKRAALTFANLNKDIPTKNKIPVLENKEFEQIISNIL